VAGFGAVDLAVSKAGDLLYFSTSVRGGARPMWVARDGRAQLVDPGWDIGPETMLEWALSPDGRRLAVSVGTRGQVGGSLSDVWVKDLDQGPLSKLTFGGVNTAPAWSADGKTVYYVSGSATDPTFSNRLHRVAADGAGTPEPLPSGPRAIAEIAVSPRDGWVVVSTSPVTQGAGDLLAFRPSLDTVMTPLLQSAATEGAPALSPDGRWLAYTSTESGRNEVYIRPFPNVTQGKWQVSLDGGLLPKWSHKGDELFYATRTGPFMSAEIGTKPTLTIGRRRVLHNVPVTFPAFDVAPDDQRTLRFWPVTGGDSAQSTLVLVQNFLAELRARR
jgi:Tol biopolymer transport system component